MFGQGLVHVLYKVLLREISQAMIYNHLVDIRKQCGDPVSAITLLPQS